MSTQAQRRLSREEYLALERQAQERNAYLDGQVFAMSGASRRHNLISVNIAAALHAQLKQRPCELYVSDMRVRIKSTGLYTYPDLVVACGDPDFEDSELDTLLNPTLIVEILSKSTEDYDQGSKFEHYRALESLREYVLVAQQKLHVVHYARQEDDTWLLTESRHARAEVELPSIGCRLALGDVYAKVTLADLATP